MTGGITNKEKENLLKTLDSTDEIITEEQPAKKDNSWQLTNVIRRKEKEIKEYNKIPVLLYPISGETQLRADILLVLANDKTHLYGVQAGDIWIELSRKTPVSNIKKAIYALERQKFIKRSKVNNLINKKSCPLYRINNKVITIKEVSGNLIENPPHIEPLEKEKTITKKQVEKDVISERMASMELVTNQILNEENAKSKKMERMELVNNQILNTLNDKNHIMPLIKEIHKMKNTMNSGLDNLNFRIDMQNLKNTKYMPNEGLKNYYDGRFSGLKERLELNMNPIGLQTNMSELTNDIIRLKKITPNHGRLPELYEKLLIIYADVYNTYKDTVEMHCSFEREIWNRLTAPQRKEDRERERMNQEAIDRMNAKNEPIEGEE